jgi:hypothetical protein
VPELPTVYRTATTAASPAASTRRPTATPWRPSTAAPWRCCGLDVDYPLRQRDLAAAIAERGALVSEFPFGAEPRPWR